MTELTVERTFRAPPKQIFEAWLDPKALVRFMCPAPGATVPEATCNPKTGGAFRLVMAVGEARIPIQGTYTVLDPYSALHFTWQSDHAGGDSEVQLTFEPRERGTHTHLKLTHLRLPTPAARAAHEAGWTLILSHLETLKGGQDA